jgi:hypothetical protein
MTAPTKGRAPEIVDSVTRYSTHGGEFDTHATITHGDNADCPQVAAGAKHCQGHKIPDPFVALRAERASLLEQNRVLREALKGTLSWLTSYPGGGALKCYDAARDALATKGALK